jgi:hypothetical protein
MKRGLWLLGATAVAAAAVAAGEAQQAAPPTPAARTPGADRAPPPAAEAPAAEAPAPAAKPRERPPADRRRPPRTGRGDAVACANLIYAGTRSSVCFSDRFLSAAARDTTINTARKFKPVKLAGDEVFGYPFAIMTGEGSFVLTEAERANLKRYLERGGFLVASAGCSSRQWDASFRREFHIVFPDHTLEAIPMDHEIFHTIYDIKHLKTKGAPAKLEGLTLGGKVVLIYTSDGLNDTSTMHGCCCCGGNEILNSQQMNANILAYALLQ